VSVLWRIHRIGDNKRSRVADTSFYPHFTRREFLRVGIGKNTRGFPGASVWYYHSSLTRSEHITRKITSLLISRFSWMLLQERKSNQLETATESDSPEFLRL
jgi:hypothetical protein